MHLSWQQPTYIIFLQMMRPNPLNGGIYSQFELCIYRQNCILLSIHFPCFDTSHLPCGYPAAIASSSKNCLNLIDINFDSAWYDGAHPSMHDCKLTLYIAVNYLHVYSLLRIQGDNEMEVAG